MTVRFEILSDLNIVYVRYGPQSDLTSTIAAAEACIAHPDFNPTMPHLFDLSRMTQFEADFAEFFAMQARMVDIYPPEGGEQLGVFIAPTEAARQLAELVRRQWDDVPHMHLRIVDTHEQAFDILRITDKKQSLFKGFDAADTFFERP